MEGIYLKTPELTFPVLYADRYFHTVLLLFSCSGTDNFSEEITMILKRLEARL